MSNPVRKVLVVGRDAPLWLSVLALHHALSPAGIAVEAVELPAMARPQDIQAALPALEAFHSRIGLDEGDVLKATRGSFSMGQMFEGFAAGRPFFHAYGSHGTPIAGVPFLPYLTRARRQGLGVAFEDFSLTAAAAKQGRFVLPDDETGPFARTDYGYHLPAMAYGEMLKRQALRRVPVHAARHAEAVLDAGGDMAAVDIGGLQIAADLFVDATGAQSLLLRKGLNTPFESWRHWFPGDRVLTAAGPALSPIPPYARITAADTGWTGLFAARDATHIVHVFDGSQTPDEIAARGIGFGDAVVTPLAPGGSTAWVRNCIGIGEAACVFDPLDAVGLQAVQIGLAHLVTVFPYDRVHQPERAEYNRLMTMANEGLRDFQLLHHVLCRRTSAFWQKARAAPPPDRLRHRLDSFLSAGVLAPQDQDSFTADSWNAALLGHGLVPDAYDPRADLTPDAALKGNLQYMLGFIREQVGKAYDHDTYLKAFCGG
ncbi:tryptophan 7-halogenase [Asticcacaulis solisilvae]|uniref:tryptophan 7-halogenase n=1 Tax=Asticcacaulis solisilvae TaxID=1217274 RepID=UPI003FD7F063